MAIGAPLFVLVTSRFGPDVGVFVYGLLFTFIMLPFVVTFVVGKFFVSKLGFILFSFWALVLLSRISLATEGFLSNRKLRYFGILIIVLDWLYFIPPAIVILRGRVGTTFFILFPLLLLSVLGSLFSALSTWNVVYRPPRYSVRTCEVNSKLLQIFWEHLEDSIVIRKNLIGTIHQRRKPSDLPRLLRKVLALSDGKDVQMTNDPLSCAALAFWLLREQDPVTVLLTRGGAIPDISINEDIGTQLEVLSSFELLAMYISRLLGQKNYQFIRTGFFREGNLVVSYTIAEYAVASKIFGFYPLLENMKITQRSTFTEDQGAIYVGSIRKELVTGFTGSPPPAVIFRRAKFGLVVAVGEQLLTMWAARTQNDDTMVETVVCIMLGNSIAAVAETFRSYTEHVLTCYEYLWFICCLGGRCYPSCRGSMRDRHIVGAGIFFARLFHTIIIFSVLCPPEIGMATLFLTVVPSLLGHFGLRCVMRRLDHDHTEICEFEGPREGFKVLFKQL
jgi:hypothetical protein